MPPAHSSEDLIAIEKTHGVAAKSLPPVVIARARGSWVQDVEGNRYLDMFAGDGGLNHGHRHPAIMAAFKAQADRVTLTSASFHHDQLGPFLSKLTALSDFDVALPLNTDGEAVQTVIGIARTWAAVHKGTPARRAEVIVVAGSSHERIVKESAHGLSEPSIVSIPFGDTAALESAITDKTAAFLVEPIQGTNGLVIPPPSFFVQVRSVCSQHKNLRGMDETRTGLGRTGHWFAFQHYGIRPDCVLVGKALGGGVMPVSAVLAQQAVMDGVATSTLSADYAGNPMASAVALASLDVVEKEQLCERAAELGTWFMGRLREMDTPHVVDVRGFGLLIGIELALDAGTTQDICDALLRRGIVCKARHPQVLVLTPALTINQDDLEWVLEHLQEVLQ